MNEEILANETTEETVAVSKETETSVEETATADKDPTISSPNADGSTNVEDATSDPVTEQSEGTGSDAASDTEEAERTFTEEELEQIVTAVLADEQASELETTEEMEEIPRTLFNTPLEEYTVSEGLLVCIFLLLLANLINSIFKGSHWFGKL